MKIPLATTIDLLVTRFWGTVWRRTRFFMVVAACCTTVTGCQSPSRDSGDQNAVASSRSIASGPSIGAWGFDTEGMKPSFAPGNSFYDYANGTWLETTEIPPDKTYYSSFMQLRELTENQVRTLLEAAREVSTETETSDITKKVGDFYHSFLDTTALNARSLEPIQPFLDAIDKIANTSDLTRVFVHAYLARSVVPFRPSVRADRRNPDEHLLTITVSGLGLPNKIYYLSDASRYATLRARYQINIEEILKFSSIKDPATMAQEVLDLETKIASHHWENAEKRDRERTYNVTSVDEFIRLYPGFDWKTWLQELDMEVTRLNTAYPTSMAPIIDLISSTSLETWRAYLSYHLIVQNSFMLPKPIDDRFFAFYRKNLLGQKTKRERWKRAVDFIGSRRVFGEAIGKMYIEKHFPPEAKLQVDELVTNVREAFRQRLQRLPWMGDKTRTKALAKLATFAVHIAYPNVWRAYEGIDIRRGELGDNVWGIRSYWNADQISRLNRPTDRDEWTMTPQTVNASYNASFNKITFPAGILQAPFFDPNADAAVNYGGIGAVIGHELGHGFDDQGSKFSASGVMENWWTEDDRTSFKDQTARLVQQYDQYEALPGEFLDGENSLGENIGDLGGVSIALEAYRLHVEKHGEKVIDGLTGEQRFFLSYAQIWRYTATEETLLNRIRSGVHSPPEYRVNGIVRNIDAWYDAFDVKEGHALYLRPEDRVSIW